MNLIISLNREGLKAAIKVKITITVIYSTLLPLCEFQGYATHERSNITEHKHDN